jgi:hypothetical protein
LVKVSRVNFASLFAGKVAIYAYPYLAPLPAIHILRKISLKLGKL